MVTLIILGRAKKKKERDPKGIRKKKQKQKQKGERRKAFGVFGFFFSCARLFLPLDLAM